MTFYPRSDKSVERVASAPRAEFIGACCVCCAGPTLILVVLGMVNPLVVVGVTRVVAAEKARRVRKSRPVSLASRPWLEASQSFFDEHNFQGEQ
jgi:hypothetical protein